MEIKWEGNPVITVKSGENCTVISADRDGLISLSRIFASLADEAPGAHVHLDSFNSLEDGSAELIIEKTE